MKIHQPGIEVQQIKMVNGVNEFCQEFFDDVAIPAADVLGEVNDGWTVATRLLYHEREAVAGGSPFSSGVSGMHSDQLIRRVARGMASGAFTAPAGSLPRLYAATSNERRQDITLAIAGAGAAVWEEGSLTGQKGIHFLMRQGGSLGGGSNEMQRNIISERLLATTRRRPVRADGARVGRSRRPDGQRMTPLILSSNSASWS